MRKPILTHRSFLCRVGLLVFSFYLLASLTGCGSSERYRYVEDAPHNTPMPIYNNYDATIYPNDRLYISVGSENPSSVKAFNEETNKASTSKVNGYLVSQSGYIMFPVLGRLEAAGKTRKELAREIESKLINDGYVTDPMVTVDLMNFHVTVIGEVKEPKLIEADGSRLTIFEALAQAGDITIHGLRTNVVVVRSGVNTEIVDTLDLTRKSVFDSPYYSLQQNDIIFVEPTEKRKKQAWRDEDWPHYLSISISAVRTAYSVIYRIIRSTK